MGPGTLDKSRTQDFLPSMKALYVGPPFQLVGNLFPVLATKLFDRDSEELVFLFRPFPHGSSTIRTAD